MKKIIIALLSLLPFFALSQRRNLNDGDGLPVKMFQQATPVTVSGTTANTTIIGSGTSKNNKTIDVPSALYEAYAIEISGRYSAPALAVATVTVSIELGGVVIASGTANSLLNSATNLPFSGKVYFYVSATGSSGSVTSLGDMDYAIGNNMARLYVQLANGVTPTTINWSTNSRMLDVKVQCSSASGSYSFTSMKAEIVKY